MHPLTSSNNHWQIALLSLLQPAPETYEFFDDLILMAEGKIVYHGPRSQALQFFKDCGFWCPERKGVADFLQEVISKKDLRQYWYLNGIPYRYLIITATYSVDNYNPATWMLESTSASLEAALQIDFAQIYKESYLYRDTLELVTQLSEPQPAYSFAQHRSQNAVTPPEQTNTLPTLSVAV
ncbi:hypothetical protein RJT34_32343 [Clitoria ternatea]|uniref:ABC transporter family G domain-containing protein n=1 Tax=Clitoria ternatea TaxID=43366 RepID=A0AAN9EXI9_CLITE